MRETENCSSQKNGDCIDNNNFKQECIWIKKRIIRQNNKVIKKNNKVISHLRRNLIFLEVILLNHAWLVQTEYENLILHLI